MPVYMYRTARLKARKFPADDVISVCLEYTGMTMDQILSISEAARLRRGREIIMYITYIHTDVKISQLSHLFPIGINRIYDSVKNADQRMRSKDVAILTAYNGILSQLKNKQHD